MHNDRRLFLRRKYTVTSLRLNSRWIDWLLLLNEWLFIDALSLRWCLNFIFTYHIFSYFGRLVFFLLNVIPFIRNFRGLAFLRLSWAFEVIKLKLLVVFAFVDTWWVLIVVHCCATNFFFFINNRILHSIIHFKVIILFVVFIHWDICLFTHLLSLIFVSCLLL